MELQVSETVLQVGFPPLGKIAVQSTLDAFNYGIDSWALNAIPKTILS
jgi:hypothetical protein